MAGQLFGTDGIRGVAGEFPLDRQTIYAFGAALGKWARTRAENPEIVLGMDTRESGPWIAEQVAGGLAPHGVRARFAGVVTTPGIAYLTRNGGFVAGVMISASHNPFHDNGLKVFGHSGYKLPDSEEHSLEEEIFGLRQQEFEPSATPLAVDEGLDRSYIDHLASTFQGSLDGVNVLVDCGHGAASHLAPPLLERLGAAVHAVGCAPTGRNINEGCGALHVHHLRQAMLERNADLGVAFDGDADRAMFVAPSGRIVDGDAVLLLVARSLHAKGRLSRNGGAPLVVATVMSNLGLERALKALGIRMARTPVGDKYVLEEMLRSGSVLGGEQSGHLIFLDYATTGDGLLTALQVLQILRESGASLDDLAGGLELYPQKLVNVRVKRKKPLSELDAVNREIRAAEQAFGDAGRVLVRFSGTEPMARVMVEGPDLARVEDFAARIAETIRAELA